MNNTEVDINAEAMEEHRAAFQSFVNKIELKIRAQHPKLSAAEGYAVIALSLYVALVEAQQEISDLKEQADDLKLLSTCAETIHQAVNKDDLFAIGLARGLGSLAKEKFPGTKEKFPGTKEEVKPEQETPGSSLMRAMSLEIQNAAANDKDEVTWLAIRCHNTISHLYPKGHHAAFTERQIRSAWHAYAARNDLDFISLHTVTNFILELTR